MKQNEKSESSDFQFSTRKYLSTSKMTTQHKRQDITRVIFDETTDPSSPKRYMCISKHNNDIPKIRHIRFQYTPHNISILNTAFLEAANYDALQSVPASKKVFPFSMTPYALHRANYRVNRDDFPDRLRDSHK